jgi:hypothetical protein
MTLTNVLRLTARCAGISRPAGTYVQPNLDVQSMPSPRYLQQVPGSFFCPCDNGYVRDPSANKTSACSDLDECSRNACGDNADCTNSVGSFTCRCQSGFRANQGQCLDVDEVSLLSTSVVIWLTRLCGSVVKTHPLATRETRAAIPLVPFPVAVPQPKMARKASLSREARARPLHPGVKQPPIAPPGCLLPLPLPSSA